MRRRRGLGLLGRRSLLRHGLRLRLLWRRTGIALVDVGIVLGVVLALLLLSKVRWRMDVVRPRWRVVAVHRLLHRALWLLLALRRVHCR